jgi:vanillate O-demethylase ferredoxin subunit
MSSELLTVKVAKRAEEAKDIITLELVDPEGKALPAFTAGSHIDVHLPNTGNIRQYSLWNDPAETHRYCLGVLRDPESRGGSLEMHGAIREGNTLKISHPRNHFHLQENPERFILLAGGIGITPLLSMAQRLHAIGKDFELHYCSRSKERTAFFDLIKNSDFKSRVKFHFDDGGSEQLLDIPALVGRQPEGTHLYVCGPQGFMNAVINAASVWDPTMIHREYFTVQEDHEHDSGFKVMINSTGQLIDIPEDSTITEVLEQHGINIPVSCEQGVCGTCMTSVIEGEIEHHDYFLTDPEKEAGDVILPCCSRAKGTLVLDI